MWTLWHLAAAAAAESPTVKIAPGVLMPRLNLAAAAAAESPTVKIAPGVLMPRLNLGTCCGSLPQVGVPAWFAAGGAGIDTAFDYLDEPTIANILATSGKPRASYFLTTKVPAGIGALEGNTTDCSLAGGNNLTDVALNYVRVNIAQLGVKHVDLVLLHAPCRFALHPVADPTASDNALWRGLMAAKSLGLTRAIGVSNYNSTELAALEGDVPAVNQCQMSIVPDNVHSAGWPMPPIAHDDATIAYCAAHGITYEAWRVLGGCPFTDPTLLSMARTHNVSAAQICLRWTLQRGAIVAAGTGANASTVGEYSAENLGALDFALTAAEMSTLSAMSPQPQPHSE